MWFYSSSNCFGNVCVCIRMHNKNRLLTLNTFICYITLNRLSAIRYKAIEILRMSNRLQTILVHWITCYSLIAINEFENKSHFYVKKSFLIWILIQSNCMLICWLGQKIEDIFIKYIVNCAHICNAFILKGSLKKSSHHDHNWIICAFSTMVCETC